MIEPKYPTEADIDLEITEVRKHNWKSPGAKEHLKEPLNTTTRYSPLVTVREVEGDTDREVAMVDRGELRREEVVNAISALGLAVETAHNRAFVAEDEETATDAASADQEGRDHDLGELLGYPDCCIEHHDPEDPIQPFYEMACRSESAVARDDDNQEVLVEDFRPLTNVVWAYLGWSMLDHRPCSFDCEESEEIGKARGSIYRDVGLGDEAERLWEFLATPLTWSGYHGLTNIRSGYLIGSTLTHDYWDEKVVVLGEDHSEEPLL